MNGRADKHFINFDILISMVWNTFCNKPQPSAKQYVYTVNCETYLALVFSIKEHETMILRKDYACRRKVKVAAHLFRPEPPPKLPTPQITSEPTRYAHT